MNKIKVYYNSACPVCKAGIEDQRCRMEAQGVADVEWLDVHTNPALANEIAGNLEFVRERLHVKDANGSVHVGMSAINVLFGKTRGQQWMSKILAWCAMRKISDFLYNKFARVLYRWNRAKGHW